MSEQEAPTPQLTREASDAVTEAMGCFVAGETEQSAAAFADPAMKTRMAQFLSAAWPHSKPIELLRGRRVTHPVRGGWATSRSWRTLLRGND